MRHTHDTSPACLDGGRADRVRVSNASRTECGRQSRTLALNLGVVGVRPLVVAAAVARGAVVTLV